MTKSRSFSIYLLKEGISAEEALKDDHELTELPNSEHAAFPNGKIYLYDPAARQPWWKDYFGINTKLLQGIKGSLVFLEAADRNFALSYGPAHFSLRDESYEYDFGLLVTLNCIEPDAIRNTDILQPGAARRQRTQVNSNSDLTYFDFDRDSSILRTLTGNVRPEYQDLFKFATGASNLRISTSVEPGHIDGLCASLLDIYQKKTYKDAFPGIQNIKPVRDPQIISKLDSKLVLAFHDEDENLLLTVPEIVDLRDDLWFTFKGAGQSKVYPELEVSEFYSYLKENNVQPSMVTIDDLRRYGMNLASEDGARTKSFSIYKSLTFDTKMAGSQETYYLSEANWYEVDNNFVRNLKTFLDVHCSPPWTPPCTEKPESAYNIMATKTRPGAICLDKTSATIKGQTAIEPCDIYSRDSDYAVLTHIKIGTGSSQLSHLFNQGANSAVLLRSSDEARNALVSLVKSKEGTAEDLKTVAERKFRVEYGIITRKPASAKSDNLPLFSRISLRRAIVDLDLMNIPATFGFIDDRTPKETPHVKPRKKAMKKI